jgi:hypothetical protein
VKLEPGTGQKRGYREHVVLPDNLHEQNVANRMALHCAVGYLIYLGR